MKKWVPLIIVLAFGGVAYYLWRKNYVATNGIAPGANAVSAAPPVLGFTGTASRTGSTLDYSSGPAGFPSAQTGSTVTNTSGGFSGTAAKSTPQQPLVPGLPVYNFQLPDGTPYATNVPASAGPAVSARSGRGQF